MKVFIFLLAYTMSSQSIAESVIDLEKNKEFRIKFHIYDYRYIHILGFNKYRNNFTYTSLFKDKKDKNPRGYLAGIRTDANGQTIYFSEEDEDCVPNQINDYDLISVNGKNIQVISGCVRHNDKQSIVYYMKTLEGNKYVFEQFESNNFVEVRFQTRLIPFETIDFIKYWYGGAAL